MNYCVPIALGTDNEELSFSYKFIYRNAVTASRLKSDLRVSFKLYLQAEEAK